MKRLFCLILALLATSLLFAQTTLYNEGSVKVAGIGELPAGLFAKAKGYLPGDTITLTNTITGEEIKLLNLGTPDTEDVILLSKEAAERLGINGKDNLDIRLPERHGNIEESVSGQGLVKKSTAKRNTNPKDDEYQDTDEDFDSYKASLEKPSPAELKENGGKAPVKVEEKPAPVPEKNNLDVESDGETVVSNEKVVGAKEPEKIESEKIEDVFFDEPEPIDEENVDEPEADLSIPENSYAASEKIDDESLSVPEDDIAEENVDLNEEISFEDDKNASDNAVSEKIDLEPFEQIYDPENDLDGENVASNEKVSGEKATKPISKTEKVEETIIEEPYSPEDDLNGEGVASNEKVTGEKAKKEKPYSPENDLAGEGVASNEKVTGEKAKKEKPYSPENDLAGEGVSSNEKVKGEKEPEEYAPIILVPVEERAPETVPEKTEPVKTEPVKTEPVKITPEVVDITPTPVETTYENENNSTDDVIKQHTVSLDDIKKSDYFIQIATISDPDGLKELINKYSKYDIVLVKNKNGTYKVLVGPLTVDEYGVILKRFKSFGFKDAFLFRKK